MSTDLKLYEIANEFKELEELADSSDLPEEVIRDTLEGLTGDLTAKAQNVAFFVRNLEANADAIDNAAWLMEQRANRLRKRAESVKNYLLYCFTVAGIRKVECPEFVLAVRANPPAVKIAEGVTPPDEYMVWPQAPPPRPDKKKLAQALKDGKQIDGVYLEQGERLAIET